MQHTAIALFNLGNTPGSLGEALNSVLHNILVAVLFWRYWSFGWRSIQAFRLRLGDGWLGAGNTFQWIVANLNMFRRHGDDRRKL